MPLSDIWTLEPHGTPGSASTLTARGVTSAGIAWANQDAGKLSLTIAAEDVGGADVSDYTYRSRWVLRRDGAVFFRGRVRSVPRRSSSGSVTIELVDAWDDLSRTGYMQEWDTVDDDGSIIQSKVPRALLSGSLSRQTAAQCLATVIAAYNEVGSIPLTLSANLPVGGPGGGIFDGGGVGGGSRLLPPIEAANLSCAALIRAILEYCPGATASIQYGASTDVLKVTDRSLSSALAFAVGSRPLQDFDLVRRDDLVVDAVHVYYEAETTRFSTVAGTDGDPDTIRARRRMAIFSDKYPAASTATDQTMVVALPAPAIADPPQAPMPQMVAIKVRPIPQDGATNVAAQKWWLDKLGLSVWGMTEDHVFLPSSSSDGQVHRVRFAWAVADPNDPLHEMPSAINPNSTVVWRPDAVTDVPNELVSGSLSEWMRVESAELSIDATVYLKKSVVDANAARKKVVLAMSPRVGKLGSVDAYIIDREVRCMGTNAKTKVYKNVTAVGSYDPAADTAAAIAAARAEAVVPNLARDLFSDRATAPWEGTIPLVEEEAGGRRCLGRVVNLTHPDRPEWATMRAQVQRESLDLTRGTTTLEVGPPSHLSPQNRAALWQAARMARAERTQAARLAPPPASDESDDSLDRAGSGGVFPGTVAPKLEVKPTSANEARGRLWDVEVVDATTGEVKIGVAGQVRKTADVDGTGAATITDLTTAFTLSVGDYLLLELDKDGTSVALKKLDTWTNFPWPWSTTDDANGFPIMDKGHFPLHKAIALPDPLVPGLHTRVNETMALVRLVADAHLDVYDDLEESPDGKFVAVKTLKPGWGAC